MVFLQHNPPPVMATILRRMLYMLRSGGLSVFQMPTYQPNYQFKTSDYLEEVGCGEMEMHIFPQPELFGLVQEAGCSILDVFEDVRAGPERLSNVFVVGK